ncbi:hypothetical protein RN001_009384 [Aquatica leii]|uniref:Uncharacterized protein n=1 Tax=Aquatica leii TaxID=1421715 RepID=A0AAN7P6L1_9COLE|nr:hypothetical protein RN001_009384 [Aquatica leii]
MNYGLIQCKYDASHFIKQSRSHIHYWKAHNQVFKADQRKELDKKFQAVEEELKLRKQLEAQRQNIQKPIFIQQSANEICRASRRNIRRQRLAMEPGKSVAATINVDSSDSDVNDPIIDDNSDDDLSEDENDDVSAEIEYFQPEDTEVVYGKFVLVTVHGGSRKKTIYRNIAIVQDVKENEGGVNEIELL